MQKQIKSHRTIDVIAYTAILLICAYLLKAMHGKSANMLVQTACMMLRSIIHIFLLTAWLISVNRRIIHKQVKRLMMSSAMLLIFWLLAKLVKYEFVADGTDWLNRYIWYGYYIPMIMLPVLGFFIVAYIGKPEEYRVPKQMYLMYIPAMSLLMAVFSNDIHQLVFTYPNGIEKFHNDYGYGWMYFVIMSWFVLLGLYFVVALIKKNRMPGDKRIQQLPLIIMISAVLFWIMYSLRIIKCDLTVVDCIIIVSMLESAIQSGAIPSNTNYLEIFDATTLPVIVVDNEYIAHYTSKGALPISDDKMREAKNGSVTVGNTIVNSAPIKAGYAVWQDDITELNKMMDELREINKQLAKEKNLLKNELELKEHKAKVEEKGRLYDRIVQEVSDKLSNINAMIQEAEKNKEQTSLIMAKICVIGSYIKRRGNLLLLNEESKTIPVCELEYSLRESLDNLKLHNISSMMQSSMNGYMPLESIIAVYDMFETVIERLLDRITAVMIYSHCGDGRLKMRMQVGCIDSSAIDEIKDINFEYGDFSCSNLDEDIFIDIIVAEKEKVK